jgi:hypothetical protein
MLDLVVFKEPSDGECGIDAFLYSEIIKSDAHDCVFDLLFWDETESTFWDGLNVDALCCFVVLDVLLQGLAGVAFHCFDVSHQVQAVLLSDVVLCRFGALESPLLGPFVLA